MMAGVYPRASRTRRNEELENSTHARGTRAGTVGGVAPVEGWSVPACVPHAEEEELESSIHARGTRAGTIHARGTRAGTIHVRGTRAGTEGGGAG